LALTCCAVWHIRGVTIAADAGRLLGRIDARQLTFVHPQVRALEMMSMVANVHTYQPATALAPVLCCTPEAPMHCQLAIAHPASSAHLLVPWLPLQVPPSICSWLGCPELHDMVQEVGCNAQHASE
jgi:hypothetical protein